MVLFNMWAAPGSGKTTTATALYLAFKKRGYNVDLVGEAARDHIYGNATSQLVDNQFLVSAEQWERVVRLSRYGCEVAVCDSPLIQGLLYSSHLPYHNEMEAVLRKCDAQFPSCDVFIHRVHPYRAAERRQTEEEAKAFEPIIRNLIGRPFWLEINGDDEGTEKLTSCAVAHVESLRSTCSR